VVLQPGDVTPVRRDLCRIDFVAAWNCLWLSQSFDLCEKIPAAGHLTMIQQAEGLKYNPHLMLIDDADRQQNGISR